MVKKKKPVKQQTTYSLIDWSERFCLKNRTKNEIETYFLDEDRAENDIFIFDSKDNEYVVETETITRLTKIPKSK